MRLRFSGVFFGQMLLCSFVAMSVTFAAGVLFYNDDFSGDVPKPLLFAWQAFLLTAFLFVLTYGVRLFWRWEKVWVVQMGGTVALAWIFVFYTSLGALVAPAPAFLEIGYSRENMDAPSDVPVYDGGNSSNEGDKPQKLPDDL